MLDMSDTVRHDDRSYLYGDALFETVRVADGRARWLEHHVARLRRSGAALGYPEAAIEEGVRVLRARVHAQDGLWRVTISRPGEGAPFGGTGTVTCRWREAYTPRPLHLCALDGWYLPDDWLAEHKTTSYLRAIEARRAAAARGADDGVWIARDGRVGRISSGNLFVVCGASWITPPVEGILPGVTRAGILALASQRGQRVEVRAVRREELERADALILTSAGMGACAAASFAGRALDPRPAERASTWLQEVSE